MTRDIDVAALDGTIVLLATLGGKYTDKFDIGAVLYKRLTVRSSGMGLMVDSWFDIEG